MKRAFLVGLVLFVAAPTLAAAQEGEIPPSPFEEPAAPARRPRPARPRPARPRPAPEPEQVPEPERAQPLDEAQPEQPAAPAPEPIVPQPVPTPAGGEEEPGWPALPERRLEGLGYGDRDVRRPEAPGQSIEASHEEPGAEVEEHAPSVNYTEFAASILNFVLWLAIFVFLLRKPVTAFLTSRRRAVVEGLEEAARLKDEAEKKFTEYSDKLAHLDEELQKLRQEMIQAGESERDRIIAEAETRAARMRKDGQFLIDQQMKQLKADLTREAIEAAVGAAEEVLRRETSISDQERLAQDYLANIASSIKDEVSA
jgi:F-type H+-transporting ATPase subunit b